MAEFWETSFSEKQLMWGMEPTFSAISAGNYFAQAGAKNVLIPGVGYGRNVKPFIERGMSVTGIEISETAIGLARSHLGLDIPIHHGSVTEMPYDTQQYDGIFCYGLIQLLDANARVKLIRDCYQQLAPGGHMIFSAISKESSMYGQGSKLGEDWFEKMPGLRLYFYDEEAVRREFGASGLVEISRINEPLAGGDFLPFFNVVCQRR